MIWLLIITMHVSGTMYIGGPPEQSKLVSSPEAAAVEMWTLNERTDVWTRYNGRLLRINRTTMAVDEVPIPPMTFGKAP